MNKFDLSRLGAWADLPFWAADRERLEKCLQAEGRTVFPPPSRMFAALERCQPDDTNVVILGQDPYHTPGKADGLAFSIPQDFGGRLDSLSNIFKELHADLHVNRARTDLYDWADQGVLLLNTALTVPQGKAGGHARLGWDRLTQQVIGRLADRPRAYILWGRHAQAFAPNRPDDLVIATAHPSPLSARHGFFGSRPFSKVNGWLRQHGHHIIDWADSA